MYFTHIQTALVLLNWNFVQMIFWPVCVCIFRLMNIPYPYSICHTFSASHCARFIHFVQVKPFARRFHYAFSSVLSLFFSVLLEFIFFSLRSLVCSFTLTFCHLHPPHAPFFRFLISLWTFIRLIKHLKWVRWKISSLINPLQCEDL